MTVANVGGHLSDQFVGRVINRNHALRFVYGKINARRRFDGHRMGKSKCEHEMFAL